MDFSSGKPGKKIGLFGATFDPPHLAHLTAIQTAYQKLSLSKVLLLPANINPLKQNHQPASNEIRLQMLHIITVKYPFMQIYTGEIERGGVSYMIETLRELQTAYPLHLYRFYLLIGADAALDFRRWKDYQAIPDYAEIVIFNRPGYNLNKISSSFPSPHQILRIPSMKISSTQIRQKIREGRPIEGDVMPEVDRIIKETRLYL